MSLEAVFKTFSKGAEMDGRTWCKLCKDVKIMDSSFTRTDADLIFSKVKTKGARKITYAQFNSALEEVANRKKVDVADIVAIVENSSGPEFTGTRTDDVRFYDDKSQYTGVHKHGGPTTVDKGRTAISDLSDIADRSSYDIRGVHQGINSRISK